MTLQEELKQATDEYWAKIQAIADRVFKNDVKWWLDRNRYRFSAGMGTWVVYDEANIDVISQGYCPSTATQTARDIHAILDTEITDSGETIGSIMDDYPSQKRKK